MIKDRHNPFPPSLKEMLALMPTGRDARFVPPPTPRHVLRIAVPFSTNSRETQKSGGPSHVKHLDRLRVV